MNRLTIGNQRGVALILVLGWASLLLPLLSWLYLQALADQFLVQNLRREVDAFHVAEAGLNFALAAISRCHSSSCALAGPDGVLGTTDDGQLVGDPSGWRAFGESGGAFRVSSSAADETTVRIRSFGRGWGGGVAEVEALVHWEADGTVRIFWNQILDP
ncbi:MAG: hypothetical protein KatS3mg077_3264 [Candidatus Binatia bacterium]|nr:MAG: hypothetical protein KatS3mg077_3264 [Candidatus Binatia bacterium]